MVNEARLGQLYGALRKINVKIDRYREARAFKERLAVAPEHLTELDRLIKIEEERATSLKTQITELGGTV